MLVLRDGRKLIGVLRSWDQFGTSNLTFPNAPFFRRSAEIDLWRQQTSSSKTPSSAYSSKISTQTYHAASFSSEAKTSFCSAKSYVLSPPPPFLAKFIHRQELMWTDCKKTGSRQGRLHPRTLPQSLAGGGPRPDCGKKQKHQAIGQDPPGEATGAGLRGRTQRGDIVLMRADLLFLFP